MDREEAEQFSGFDEVPSLSPGFATRRSWLVIVTQSKTEEWAAPLSKCNGGMARHAVA